MTENLQRGFKLRALDIFLIFSFALAVLFFTQTNAQPPYNVYPKLISVLLAVFSLACFIQEQMKAKNPEDKWDLKAMLKPTVIISSILIYTLAISYVGYFVSSYFYLLVLFQANRFKSPEEFLETKTIIIDAVLSIIVCTMIGLIFKLALKLVFPDAWLF